MANSVILSPLNVQLPQLIEKKEFSIEHWYNRITFIQWKMCTLNHMVWLVIACTTKHSHHTDSQPQQTPNQIISITIIIKKAVPPELSYVHKLCKFCIIVATVSRGIRGTVRCSFFGCRISFDSNWLNGIRLGCAKKTIYTIVFASTAVQMSFSVNLILAIEMFWLFSFHNPRFIRGMAVAVACSLSYFAHE